MIPAPPWAFTAEAIDAIGDPHLAKGMHIRALSAPAAGLPATPLFVYRADLGRDRVGRLARHSDVVWIDSFGNVLTAPFSVKPDNPVTGHLVGGQAIWAQLSAVGERIEPVTFAGLVNSPNGLRPFGVRFEEPYVVAGQRIDAVRVSGRGRVNGLRWISRDEALRELDPKLRMVWSLPVDPAPRYKPTPDARSEAKDRVQRGNPQRVPQYGVAGQTAPGASPPASGSFSLDRIGRIEADLDRWLETVLHDLSLPTFDLVDAQPYDDGSEGSLSLPIEPHILGASVDPDVGHWLGFGDVDDADGTAGTLRCYFIRGLWRYAADQWSFLHRVVLASHRRASRDDAAAAFDDLRNQDLVPELEGPYLDLTALAVTAVGVAPLRPNAPAPIGFEDRGWLPEPPPPDVRRHVRVRLDNMVPRALIAAVADDGRRRILNPVIGEGRPAPNITPPPEDLFAIVATEAEDNPVPHQSRIDDRDALEGPATYLVAQGDWFGRWSEWSSATNAAKPRTPPLQPVVELAYQPPALPPGGPIPDGPLAGMAIIRVPIPNQVDLPPGGFPLDRLDIDISVGGTPATTTSFVLAASGMMIESHPGQHNVLVVTRAGPPLDRAASTTLTVTARWIDSGNLVSPDSIPATRTLLDPRPPAPPIVPTELQYSARPDATGYARVELEWPSAPGVSYRVFASNETTMLGALRAGGQGGIADAIAATPTGAPRAGAIRDQKHRFSWNAFECVTADPIPSQGATTRFTHRVSGSLDVLATYRVVAEGPSGALPELSDIDIIPVAVPNYGPPPGPLASLVPMPYDHDAITNGVEIAVAVPPGRATPDHWRVRRASVPVTDALRMDVIATGAIPPGSQGIDGTRFTISLPEPLRPWRTYAFVVEVQSGPPPGAPTAGSIPIGEWSSPSAPVTLSTVPAQPPAAFASLDAMALGTGDVLLRAAHPDAEALIGTPLGAYRIELYRLSPGARPTRLAIEMKRMPSGFFEATDPAPPAGSAWSVRAIDPVGRPGPSLTVMGPM